MQMPLIHIPKPIAIPNQTTLPMVVEIIPTHRDPIARPYDIALSVILIWSCAGKPTALELVVVYPYPGAVLNGYPVVACDSSDAEIADDHVELRLDVEAAGENVRAGAGADE